MPPAGNSFFEPKQRPGVLRKNTDGGSSKSVSKRVPQKMKNEAIFALPLPDLEFFGEDKVSSKEM